jgi:hypothetical protein
MNSGLEEKNIKDLGKYFSTENEDFEVSMKVSIYKKYKSSMSLED